MNYYRITYKDGTFFYDKAKDSLTIIKRHDLATKDHIDTRITELTGEQRAVAMEYLNEGLY